MTDERAATATVAVVMRTKNRPLLLRRALRSALEQTYRDFVVVIVNDAGERAPVEDVVAEYADRAGGRIHIVHNERSNGREAAINTGIAASDSRYLVVLDDDDTWAPSFLERTVTRLADSDDAGVAVRSAVIYEKISGDTVTETGREVLATHQHDITLFEMIRRNYMPTNSLLYRRDVHEKVGLYDESLPVLADWDFNLRFLQHFTIGFIDGEPLAFWHHREASTGDLGNSVIAARTDHQDYDRAIRDGYLRDEIESRNNLGSLLYTTELLDRLQKDAQARTDHIAAQVNELDGVARNINRMVDQIVNQLDSRLHEANAQLRDLNSSAITQGNRFVARFGELERRIEDVRKIAMSQTPRERVRSYARAARGLARKARRR